MSSDATGVLAARMLEWVRKHADLPPGESEHVDVDTNLIERALLDSVGFLELIACAEEIAGRPIDLMEVDPQDLVSIRGLCRHIDALEAATG